MKRNCFEQSAGDGGSTLCDDSSDDEEPPVAGLAAGGSGDCVADEIDVHKPLILRLETLDVQLTALHNEYAACGQSLVASARWVRRMCATRGQTAYTIPQLAAVVGAKFYTIRTLSVLGACLDVPSAIPDAPTAELMTDFYRNLQKYIRLQTPQLQLKTMIWKILY